MCLHSVLLPEAFDSDRMLYLRTDHNGHSLGLVNYWPVWNVFQNAYTAPSLILMLKKTCMKSQGRYYHVDSTHFLTRHLSFPLLSQTLVANISHSSEHLNITIIWTVEVSNYKYCQSHFFSHIFRHDIDYFTSLRVNVQWIEWLKTQFFQYISLIM